MRRSITPWLVLVASLIGCHADRELARQPGQIVSVGGTDQTYDRAEPPRPTVAVQVQPAPGSQELIGQRVRVSLRRDALGLAATSTPEPDANMIAGKQVVLRGTVERFGDGWLVLKGDSKRYWIATSGILLIEVDPQ